jgi:hypothetical protein
MRVTDPAHVEVAAWLRRQFQQRAPGAVGVAGEDLSQDLVRDLSDYDRAFGLDLASGDREEIS